MTSLAWLRAGAVVGLAGALGLLVGLREHIVDALPVLASHRRRLAKELAFLRVRACAEQWVLAQLAATLAAVVTCAWSFTPLALVAVAIAWAAPTRLLARSRSGRVALLEAQLDGFLVTLANALRATPSLGDALAVSLPNTPPPLREEIDLVLKEHRLGVPLDRALHEASQRIGSRSFAAFLLVLRIARSAGGGVSQCLEQTATTLREIVRLDGVVRTKTAEGKAQAVVVSVIPIPLFGLLSWLDPNLLAPLTATSSGYVLCALALSLWLAAVLLARKIVQVDV